MFDNVVADLRHYSRYCCGKKLSWLVFFRILYTHPASLAVIWYRFGRMAYGCRVPVLRQLLQVVYLLLLQSVRIYSGVQLQPATSVGPGLAILHFGGVVIAPKTEIGSNCLLHHNVSIVTMRNSQAARIGNDFYAGTGVIVLESVIIEDNVTAGAGCIITKSVPRGAVVAGVPARILRFRQPGENPAEGKTLRRVPIGWLASPRETTQQMQATTGDNSGDGQGGAPGAPGPM
jgi:serine O-acetyltransferase